MHYEALDEKGREILGKLRAFEDFYLAGGTALALQIGHRVSIDFDLFSEKKIPPELFRKVKDTFSGQQITLSVQSADELTVFVDGVKVTFLYYPFSRILDFTEIEGLKLLQIKEIAATKAYTIGRRGSLKDYVDLFFVFSERHAKLGEIIEIAEKKYGGEFNARLFLEQLLYLEDVEEAELLILKKKVSKDDLRAFFEDIARRVV